MPPNESVPQHTGIWLPHNGRGDDVWLALPLVEPVEPFAFYGPGTLITPDGTYRTNVAKPSTSEAPYDLPA